MKIDIPRVTVALDLGAYAPTLAGQTVQIWVNPTRAFLRQRSEAFALLNANEETTAEARMAQFNDALLTWFAALWSQHPDTATHWTADELRTLDEQDPALLVWLINESNARLKGHREAEKKS